MNQNFLNHIKNSLSLYSATKVLFSLIVYCSVVYCNHVSVFAEASTFLDQIPLAAKIVKQDKNKILEPGRNIDAELKGGQEHNYEIKLLQGQFVNVKIYQKGVDVVVSLFDSSKSLITEIDHPNGTQGLESISIIATSNESYYLKIKALDDTAPAGHYEIKVEKPKLATDLDKKRFLAEKSFFEGNKLRSSEVGALLEQALKKYEEALILWREIKDSSEQAFTLFYIASIYSLQGDNQKSLNFLNQALPFTRSGNDRSSEAMILNDIGLAYKYLGDDQKAGEYFSQALNLQRVVGNQTGEATTLHNLGWLYEDTSFNKALSYYNQSLDLARKMGDRKSEAYTLNNIGKLYYEINETSKAIDYYNQSLKIRREIRDIRGEGQTLNNLGVLYASTNEPQKAIDFYNEALLLAQKVGDITKQIIALNNLANFYSASGNKEKAKEYYQKAQTLLPKIDDIKANAIVSFNLKSENNASQNKEIKAEDKDFVIKYLTAFESGNEKELSRLVQENKERAQYLAERFNEDGVQIYKEGRLDKALESFWIALSIFENLQNQNWVNKTNYNIAVILTEIGNFYRTKGEIKKSVFLYQQALELFKANGYKEEEGGALNYLGLGYSDLGEYESALGNFKSALEICLTLADSRCQKTIQLNIAGNYLRAGINQFNDSEFEKALISLQIAVKDFKSLKDKKQTAIALDRIGATLLSLGNSGQALDNYKEALSLAKEINDQDTILKSLNNIGETYNLLSDYQNAVDFFQEALSISADKATRAAILYNISSIYDQTGDWQTALRYSLESLDIYQKDSNIQIDSRNRELGAILNGIGMSYAKLNETKLAVSFLNESLNYRKTDNYKLGEAVTLINIGAVYTDLSDFETALKHLEKALLLSREIKYKAGEAMALFNMASIYSAKKNYVQSLDYFQKALSITDVTGDKQLQSEIFGNIGRIYELKGNLESALEWYKKSANVVEDIRAKVSRSEFKENYLERNIDVYSSIVEILIKLNQSEEAFVYAERSKARAFLDLLVEAKADFKRNIDPALVKEENDINGQLYKVIESLEEAPNKEEQSKLAAKRIELENKRLLIEKKIKDNNPQYKELIPPPIIDVAQIQQKILKDGEVLIEYFEGNNQFYVFIIGKNGFETHTLPNSVKELNEKIIRLIKPLHQKYLTPFDKKLSYQVYQEIFKPFESKINVVNQNNSPKTLIIVPDGIFHYFPFEVLVTNKQSDEQSTEPEETQYLLAYYPITYSASASILNFEGSFNKTQADNQLLALAPFSTSETQSEKKPVKSPLKEFQSLPYSAEEVSQIAEYFIKEKVDSKIGSEATESYFKEHSFGYRYILLATHGYLHPDLPSYSGIMFSDGMMQTYEIFNIILNSELVILSACQTGLGTIKRGEGLVGFSRAFMYAGSPTLLASMWSVADSSTAKLMTRFFRNLTKKMSKSEALRQAKIWMLKYYYETDVYGKVTKYDDPFYWAPFILIGQN